MKRKNKRRVRFAGKLLFLFLLAALAAVLIRTLGARPAGGAAESGWRFLKIGLKTAAKWDNVIAYVPLDDRTDNIESTILLAEASGYRLIMPDRDLYRTALDGQAPNANGTPYGDRAALLEWVRDMDKQGCRRFILSLDQLLSGGLANSRSIRESDPILFADGVSMDEAAAFDAYILPLARNPDKRVYLFDSVLRLSPTAGYRGFGEAEYYALRAYGMTARPALSADELTLENIVSLYPYAADGVTRAEDALDNEKFRSVLTEEILEEYRAVRRRKLSLLDHIITAVQGADSPDAFQLWIGVDDSSNSANIQRNELRYIETRLGSGVSLMPGLDSLARLLIGRCAQEEYGYQIKAAVRYIGGTENAHSSEFDLYTLKEVADLHLDFFRARQVPPEEAEVRFLVMTAPDNPARAGEYIKELIAALEENFSRRIPTVLDEASNNAYGDALEQALLQRIPFARLAAYAGKYDQANVTGAAFAMGVSRYLYLRCREKKEASAHTAQVEQMANSMALTEYILHTRAPLNEYIRNLGLEPGNMAAGAGAGAPAASPMDKAAAVRLKLEALFAPECRKVCANLRRSALLINLDPWEEREISSVSITDPVFPWERTFEISFSVRVSLAEA